MSCVAESCYDEVHAAVRACFATAEDDSASIHLADVLDRMAEDLQKRVCDGEFTRAQLCTVVAYTARVTAAGLRDGHTPDIGEHNPACCLANLLDGDIPAYGLREEKMELDHTWGNYMLL